MLTASEQAQIAAQAKESQLKLLEERQVGKDQYLYFCTSKAASLPAVPLGVSCAFVQGPPSEGHTLTYAMLRRERCTPRMLTYALYAAYADVCYSL